MHRSIQQDICKKLRDGKLKPNYSHTKIDLPVIKVADNEHINIPLSGADYTTETAPGTQKTHQLQ